MVTFNELRIDKDANKLVIDCIIDTSIYEDAYIEKIELVYFTNINSNGSYIDSSKVYTVYEDRTSQEEYEGRWLVGTECFTTLHINTFDNGLFYVKVYCSYDGTQYDTAVIPDWESVYEIGMPYVADLAAYGFNKCDLPIAFEEFVMLWYALQLAIAVCDYGQIAALWGKFLRLYEGGYAQTRCGCNG